MNPWGLFPFVRLIMPFIAGIIMGINLFHALPVSTNILLVLISCAFIIIAFPRIFITYRTRWVYGLIIFVFLFFSGIKLSQVRTSLNNPLYFKKFDPKIDGFVAVIAEPLSEKSKTYKTVVKIQYIGCSGKWHPAIGNICAYFAKDSITSRLGYGDRIIVWSDIHDVRPVQNPNEFDYKKYLSINNIYHQVYIQAEDYLLFDKNNGNPLFAFAYSSRDKLLNSLSTNKLDNDEFAVAAALLLGYKDELDPELRSAYSSAGAMHILCVSGLHVGVIFIVLNTLLGFLCKLHFGDKIRMVLLIFTIWFYAFITGLSPSVLRASCMISLVIFSGSLNRHVNIYNVLGASAFILLLIDPYILFNIGFQLSYLAVLGIVSIYKYIDRLWTTGFMISDKLWSICAVSISAQLATFPLSLYYFHQFPNLFLLTNIIVIPLSSAIIYLGMLVFISIPIGWLNGLFLEVLSFFVRAMNALIRMIEGISFSSTKMIHITEFEFLMIYLVLILIILFLNLRKKRFLTFAGIGIIVFLGFNIHKGLGKADQKFLFVYNIRNMSAYDFVSGRRNCFIADSLLLSDIKKQQYHIFNNWCALGLRNTHKINVRSSQTELINIGLFKRDNFIYFEGQRILVIDGSIDIYPCSEKLQLDKIIISGSPKISMEQLVEVFCFKEIIIDSSNSRWKAEEWIEDCRDIGVECYSVIHSEAYICGF